MKKRIRNKKVKQQKKQRVLLFHEAVTGKKLTYNQIIKMHGDKYEKMSPREATLLMNKRLFKEGPFFWKPIRLRSNPTDQSSNWNSYDNFSIIRGKTATIENLSV